VSWAQRMTMTLEPANDIERVAVHEAGHVFAMNDAGLDTSSVYITPALNGEARWLSGTANSDHDVLVMYSAGEVSERLFGFSNAGAGSERDRETAADYVREVVLGHWADDGDVERRVAASRDRARRQLVGRKAAIVRFAETLLHNSWHLAGYEVSDALRHAQNDWPTPDFSVAGRFKLTVRRREIFEDLARTGMSREELDRAWEQADVAARSGSLPRLQAVPSRTVDFAVMTSETDRYLAITEARRAGVRSWWAAR
jgi:hypothetical protein